MKRNILIIVALVIIVGVAFVGFSSMSGANSKSTPTPSAQIKTTLSNVVSAEGSVVPVMHTALAFKTGGRVVEILAREGETVKTGAALVRLDDAAVKAQVAQAEAALTVAQKQLAQLRAGATSAERQAAYDALSAARATLAKVKAGPTAEELAQLKASLDNANAVVAQAQFAYDRIGGDSNPFGNAAPERLALQQASNAQIAAQAAYRDASNHPTASELKSAESTVAQATGVVTRLDPTPEQLALAEAQVMQAQAALDSAKTALQDVVLTAPFDGTVAEIDIEVGQVVSPGVPTIIFADLANLQIETVDLAEADVAKVAVGQNVNIKLDALPEQNFTGQILRVAPVANDHRGDKVYKATIALSQGVETGLRWGMTANVEIVVGK